MTFHHEPTGVVRALFGRMFVQMTVVCVVTGVLSKWALSSYERGQEQRLRLVHNNWKKRLAENPSAAVHDLDGFKERMQSLGHNSEALNLD